MIFSKIYKQKRKSLNQTETFFETNAVLACIVYPILCICLVSINSLTCVIKVTASVLK